MGFPAAVVHQPSSTNKIYCRKKDRMEHISTRRWRTQKPKCELLRDAPNMSERNRETEKQRNRETEKQRNRETEKQRNRETEKQRNRETS
jgi:membrane protein involved in colicin uptake